MQLIEKEILDFLKNLYGSHVEYLEDSIYIRMRKLEEDIK